MYLLSDLEATGSATSRQLEELQELTKGISTIIPSHTLAELQSEHWKVVNFQTPEAPLTCLLLRRFFQPRKLSWLPWQPDWPLGRAREKVTPVHFPAVSLLVW